MAEALGEIMELVQAKESKKEKITLHTCREIAARIWCDFAYEHVTMNPVLAEQIADMLLHEANSQEK